MRSRTFQLVALFVGTFILLIGTASVTFGAGMSSSTKASPPDNTPLTQAELEAFWQEQFPSTIGAANASNVYAHELLAKALPDECFVTVGVRGPISNADPACITGQPKVNEAYVWGLTDYEETVWFGTAPNVHCLVMGGYLGMTSPISTSSYVCEFGMGPYSMTLPAEIGDWRPPSLYVYDTVSTDLTEISPNGQTGHGFDLNFVQTLGIRSAATYGDYVFFGGPALTPTNSINLFLFNASTRTYVGSEVFPGFNNIRKWIEVDGVLYVALGSPNGGTVLRYVGDPANPSSRWDFAPVGNLDTDAAEIALHDGRLFVNTWPSACGCLTGGIFRSPVIPPGGLTNADYNNWELVFSYDEYEPDPLVASTYAGGALYSYQGDLYWGTMHVPMLAALMHSSYYPPMDELDFLETILGTQRAIVIFRGRNLGEPDEEIEVVYGDEALPAYDDSLPGWVIADTLMGPPLYGPSGFGNFFNNYTWAMGEYDGQLFVGTMDWSYLLTSLLDSFGELVELPMDLEITLPGVNPGADLFRFFSKDEPAIAQDVTGVGNYSSYGIRNMITRDEGLYLGMANPMNLLTDLTDDKPEGGWELIRLYRHLTTLTVEREGNGSGSVESDVPGIDCGADCDETFDFGTAVILSATPAADSDFIGWGGACNGTGTCSVTVNGDTIVTANFKKKQFPLTVKIAGNGSGTVSSTPAGLTCNQPSCSVNFDIATPVSLSAIGFSGSSFKGWSGACSGSGACGVTINGATVVTATFELNAQVGSIEVEGLPYANSPLTLTAKLNMSQIDECTWNFGDEKTENCSPTVSAAGVDVVNDVTIQTTHVFVASGTYLVTITASNDAGTVLASQLIVIQPPTAEKPSEQPNQQERLFFPYLDRQE